MLVRTHATVLQDFVLSRLMEQAEQNATNRGLQQRPEFAAAMYEAYRSFDSIELSDELTQTKLIPGLRWITQAEPGTEGKQSLLGPYEQELMLKMIRQLEPQKPKKKGFLDDLFD